MLGRDEDILKAAEDWSKAGRGVALATVVETWGSAPRPVGSNLVIDEEGNFLGSVSGGCVEGAVVTEAIDVIDSGPGIDADKRERVFDAFYRATDQRESREHGGEGTGLGLAIVRAIVDRLGGHMQLKDASPTPPRGRGPPAVRSFGRTPALPAIWSVRCYLLWKDPSRLFPSNG